MAFETQEKTYILGAYKILTLYATKYPGEHVPARSTVEEIFKREGYTGRKKRTRKKAEDRVKAKKPKDVWAG